MTREDHQIPSHGDTLAAWCYRPSEPGPRPAVVLAHGFGAVREAGLERYAERFAAAGFVAVLFDYRHFGASGGRPRQLLSIGRQLEDWQAAVAFTRDLDGVDPDRVALWGTSFAGGHVVTTAARDPRVAAVVAQVPFADGLATMRVLPPVSALKATGAGLADLAGSLAGREPRRIPLVGRPGSLAAMPTPDAVDGYRRLFAGVDADETVAARIGLAVPLYRPVRHAAKVRCPLLVQAGEHDDLTPAAAARRLANRAPRGRYTGLATGHFEPYFDPWFDKVVDEQVVFLHEHLG